MMNELKKDIIGNYIESIFDIGSNGSDEQISKKLNMKDEPDYALMVRTLNFNSNDFEKNVKYISKESYDFFKKSKLFGNEIIVNKIGCPGSIGFMPNLNRPVSLGLNQYAIKPNNKIDSFYMYYNLKNIELYLKSLAHGTTTKSLTKDDIKNASIFVHNINSQKKIGKLFKNIDNVIQNDINIIKTTNDFIMLIYDYMFRQFSIYDMSKSKYDEKLKKNIPFSFASGKLKDLCDINSGYPFKTKQYVANGKYKLYTIKNVQDGKIISKVDNYIDIIENNIPDYCKLKIGDFLLSLTGNVGRVAMVYENNALLNQRVGIILPKEKIYKPYIYSIFIRDEFKKKLEKISTGTSQKNLSPIDTEKIIISIPDTESMNKYYNIVNPLIENIINLNIEIAKIKQIKEYLLPKLMNNSIKIN